MLRLFAGLLLAGLLIGGLVLLALAVRLEVGACLWSLRGTPAGAPAEAPVGAWEPSLRPADPAPTLTAHPAAAAEKLPSTGRRSSSLPWHGDRDEQRLAGGESAAQPCICPDGASAGGSSGTDDAGGGMSLNPPVEPGPRHCWLGLPDESAVALDFGPGDGDDAASGAAAATGGAAARVPLHRMAVLIPYRDREEHLTTLLAAL